MRDSVTQLILDELSTTLSQIDDGQFSDLVDALMVPGRRILVMGVGRVLLSLKAWCKRMKQLEFDINYVGDITEMPVGPGDLVLIGSASGESKLPVEIGKIAKSLGVSVAYVGCTPGSTIDSLANIRLIMQGRTKFDGPNNYPSKQPMSTLFEQQLYLLGDIISTEVMSRRGWTEEDIKDHHANLE